MVGSIGFVVVATGSGCGSVSLPPDVPQSIDAMPPDASTSTCDPLAPFSAPAPVNGLATSQFEQTTRMSIDELSAYLALDPASTGTCDLYVARRLSTQAAFGTPVRLSVSVSSANDFNPTLTIDQLTMVFDSDQAGGPRRIYIATRATTAADFGTAALVSNVGSSITSDEDIQPYQTADGDELWFSSNRAGGLGGRDIMHAAKAQGVFSAAVSNPELSSASSDELPVISADRLTIYLASNRTGSQGHDIWRSHRTSVQDGFPTPAKVDELETSANDYPTWISPDNCRLYMISNVAGPPQNYDVYVATRQP